MPHTEWTANQLKEYVDRVFAERQAMADSVHREFEHRLAATITMREQLTEQATNFVTNEAYGVAHRQLQTDVMHTAREAQARLEAHAREDDIQHANLRERIAGNTLEIATKQGIDVGLGRHRADTADHNRLIISVMMAVIALLGTGITALALIVR